MYDNIELIHCLPKLEYLLLSLHDGLMLRSHPVRFRPFDGLLHDDVLAEIASMASLVSDARTRANLTALIAASAPPGDRELNLVMRGLGSIQHEVPMLCFSEIVDEGRDLTGHADKYGRYAVVVKPQWVMRHDGDRVVYVGGRRSVGRHLGRVLAAMRGASLHRDDAGTLLFRNEALRLCVDLLAYVEVAQHQHELEWRIVGRHGLMGGEVDDGKRIPIEVGDIERVYVSEPSEVADVEECLRSRQSAPTERMPPVLVM